MIGKIRGIILEKTPPQLLVEAGGIGYEIDAPMSTFYVLPEVGEAVALFTHLVIREDAHHLYGFATANERYLFRLLLKVNGVGPRLALTILSSAPMEELIQFILGNDVEALVRFPGIGKKTAERLVMEMRDPLALWCQTLPHMTSTTKGARHQILQDAISALITLGYKQQDANRAVTRADDGAISSEELIRRALKEGV